MSDGISRRDATLVIAAAPALLRAAAPSAQVAFALVGAGAWGRELLKHAAGVPALRCVAVCDPDESTLRQAAGLARGAAHCRDYRAALERKDVQAALVATPHYTHFPIVRDALAAGKHVFCEPPLVFKPEEEQALREAAESADAVVQVGFQRRYSQYYQTARQMVSKGFLGDVTNIQAQWHRAPERSMDPARPREANWRYFREFSGGLAAEPGSHQIDVGCWMFADQPEFVTGVGALDWKKDGRDVYDNAALILRYPEGRQMIWSAIGTNRHLPMLGGERAECGEVIMGTEGTIEITLGTGDQPALGLWFYEPYALKVSTAEAAREIARAAGATVARTPAGGFRGMPILLDRDQISGEESFIQRELKYARRWLYSKGLMVPEEDKDPVTAELEAFGECCVEGRRPKADLEAGLRAATVVMMANRAMDEGRRVSWPA